MLRVYMQAGCQFVNEGSAGRLQRERAPLHEPLYFPEGHALTGISQGDSCHSPTALQACREEIPVLVFSTRMPTTLRASSVHVAHRTLYPFVSVAANSVELGYGNRGMETELFLGCRVLRIPLPNILQSVSFPSKCYL